MKTHLITFIVLILLILSGCENTNISGTTEDTRTLLHSIDLLKKVNSCELCRFESIIFDERVISQLISEQKIIFEPFVNWSKNDSTSTRTVDDSQYRSLIEVYHVLNDDQLDIYVRYRHEDFSASGGSVTGEWEKNSVTRKEHVDLAIHAIKSSFYAYLYLLSSNIDTFKIVENDEEVNDNILKYVGQFEQSTILEAYHKYIRGTYVKGNMLPDTENLTLEDLKNEITNGDHYELQTGIPRLAFSDKPVPVSLWIDKNTLKLKRVTVDETVVMQAYMQSVKKDNPEFEIPVISKALVTYEIKSLNTLKNIPMPE